MGRRKQEEIEFRVPGKAFEGTIPGHSLLALAAQAQVA